MTACGHMTELPVFDAPQPVGQPELAKVPDNLIGTDESPLSRAEKLPVTANVQHRN